MWNDGDGAYRLIGLAVLCACLGAGAAAAGEPSPRPGGVRGRVAIGVEAVRLADLGPFVVFLEGTDGPLAYDTPGTDAVIHQKGATFDPPFLVIAAGRTVTVANDDAIFHNVFSYSRPNDFDLGLYEKGTSRSVTFRHPGVVRIYCSIHESMNGIIFVAPSPYFDTVAASGAFEIPGVPPGTYRLRTWNEKLPEVVRDVTVHAGTASRVDVVIDERDANQAVPR
jgi:plastocyanin